MSRNVALATIALCMLGLAAATTPASAAVAHRDLSYDNGSPPADPNLNALDLYTPDGALPSDQRPVVVYFHGGGWSIGDKANQISRKVNLFTGAGYVFVSANYRLSPANENALAPDRIRFPDHPDDVGEALGWLSRHADEFGGDPSRLILMGHSAGAHLVSLVGTDPRYAEASGLDPWQVIGVVSLDTDTFDVADRIAEVGAAAKNTFYNAFATPEENAIDDAWSLASPLRFADDEDPRQLLVTQAAAPSRLDDTRGMASALGQNPDDVFAAPFDHEGINDAVGDPGDTSGETGAILAFAERMVAASEEPSVSLADHPAKRVKTSKRRAKVRFRLRSSVDGSTFECALDSKRLEECSKRATFRARTGRHRFRYRALGEQGRPGETSAFGFSVARTK